MECGLQWKDITCWDDVPRLTLTHEENLETAIADYCPDMGRVVETCGQLCLRSVTAQGGGVGLRLADGGLHLSDAGLILAVAAVEARQLLLHRFAAETQAVQQDIVVILPGLEGQHLGFRLVLLLLCHL